MNSLAAKGTHSVPHGYPSENFIDYAAVSPTHSEPPLFLFLFVPCHTTITLYHTAQNKHFGPSPCPHCHTIRPRQLREAAVARAPARMRHISPNTCPNTAMASCSG